MPPSILVIVFFPTLPLDRFPLLEFPAPLAAARRVQLVVIKFVMEITDNVPVPGRGVQYFVAKDLSLASVAIPGCVVSPSLTLVSSDMP